MEVIANALLIICLAAVGGVVAITAMILIFLRWWVGVQEKDMQEQTAKWDKQREDMKREAEAMKERIRR